MRWKYFLDTRILSLFGIVAALPIAVGFFFLQTSARGRLLESIGQDFSRLAGYAASSVDDAVLREVVHLSTLAQSPDLIRAVSAANQRGATAREAVQSIDRDWGSYAPTHPKVAAILQTEASRHLANITAGTDVYHELLLVDKYGVVAAASRKPARYRVADRPWFQEVMTGGAEGAPTISEVRRFREYDTDVITIAWPIKGASAEAEGVLRAAVDTRVLLQAVSSLRFGELGHALLFDADGQVLAGMVEEQDRYHGKEDLERAVEEKKAFFVTGLTARGDTAKAELVGYGRPQLASSFKNLDWTVVVEQPLTEAYKPIAALNRDILLYFLGMGLAVLVLALYFSFNLEKPVTDIEMDLHHDLSKVKARS